MARPRKPVSQVSDWALWKRNQRANPRPRCSRCGKAGADWHHMNRNKRDQSPRNLKPLCRACHKAEHNRNGY